MIPRFPEFRKLTYEDKEEIEKFYRGSVISSDYHFASLCAWDLNNDIEISNLNNNLVVKFKDYQTHENIYSFLGNNALDDTVNSILNYLDQKRLPPKISLLPEHNFEGYDLSNLSKKYEVIEDEGNFDYIFSVKDFLTYEKKELYTKKKQLKKFSRQYSSDTDIIIVETIDPLLQKDILRLLNKWSEGKLAKKEVNSIEINALKRTLFIIPKIKFYIFCVYIFKKIVGFSIYEIIDKTHAIHSFQKADLSYNGITEFMNHKIAEHLNSLGILYINAEQDLGIKGLRQAKRSYNPTFLKKYTITRKLAN